MKHNKIFLNVLRVIIIITFTIIPRQSHAQSSFMDRQEKIMMKNKVTKMRHNATSSPKKRYYAKRTSKPHSEYVDNSDYRSGDTLHNNGGLYYYTVSYDNHYEHGDCAANAHIEIDFPHGNGSIIDNAIKEWIRSTFETAEIPSFDSWIQTNYPDEMDALDKGEHILEYYDENIFKPKAKYLSTYSNGCIDIDTTEISLYDENSRYVSYCCHTLHTHQTDLIDFTEKYDNITFRKSDGKSFSSNIIKEAQDVDVKAAIKEALSNMAKKESDQDVKHVYESYADEESELSLPEASPSITESGLEFNYAANEIPDLPSGLTLVIPYNKAKTFMTDEAIALAMDDIGEEDINGVIYNLSSNYASVVGLSNRLKETISIPGQVSFGHRPFSVVSLNDSCFKDRYYIKTVFLPDNITSIGNMCFMGCSNLIGITIPNSVSNIGNSCFENCPKLTYAILSKNMTDLGNKTFKGCTSLAIYEIPSNITRIGNECFEQCTKLSNIKLPTSIIEIGNACFSDCTSLYNIEIPISINTLNENTFKGCTALSSAIIPSSEIIGNSCFEGCINLHDISLPLGIKTLGASTFSSCRNLFSIELPSTITEIGHNCFYNCSALSVVVCNWESPKVSVNSDEFTGIATKPYLFVPDNAKKYYKDSLPWKTFDIIKEFNAKNLIENLNEAKQKARERIKKEKKQKYNIIS